MLCAESTLTIYFVKATMRCEANYTTRYSTAVIYNVATTNMQYLTPPTWNRKISNATSASGYETLRAR